MELSDVARSASLLTFEGDLTESCEATSRVDMCDYMDLSTGEVDGGCHVSVATKMM